MERIEQNNGNGCSLSFFEASPSLLSFGATVFLVPYGGQEYNNCNDFDDRIYGLILSKYQRRGRGIINIKFVDGILKIDDKNNATLYKVFSIFGQPLFPYKISKRTKIPEGTHLKPGLVLVRICLVRF